MNINPHIGIPEIVRSVRHLFDPPREVQIDEQWSYVGHKGGQRWLWSAVDAATGCVLLYVFGRRKDEMCEKLLENLKVFNIRTYYTDDWGSYSALIPRGKHVIGKNIHRR